MLPILFFACLIIQIGLALKLFLGNPTRKLNIYLALLPGISFFSVIIEIVLYYTTDATDANFLFLIYQCIGFAVIIFLLFSIIEYIITYTSNNNHYVLNFIKVLVLVVEVSWFMFVIFRGPTAHVFLAKPHMWDIDFHNSKGIFYLHLYSTIFWLLLNYYLIFYQ